MDEENTMVAKNIHNGLNRSEGDWMNKAVFLKDK